MSNQNVSNRDNPTTHHQNKDSANPQQNSGEHIQSETAEGWIQEHGSPCEYQEMQDANKQLPPYHTLQRAEGMDELRRQFYGPNPHNCRYDAYPDKPRSGYSTSYEQEHGSSMIDLPLISNNNHVRVPNEKLVFDSKYWSVPAAVKAADMYGGRTIYNSQYGKGWDDPSNETGK